MQQESALPPQRFANIGECIFRRISEQHCQASSPECCGKGAATVDRSHWEVGMPGSKVTVQAVFRGIRRRRRRRRSIIRRRRRRRRRIIILRRRRRRSRIRRRRRRRRSRSIIRRRHIIIRR